MGSKLVSIRIDEEVSKKAREAGLNVSKVCENALKKAIEALEGTSEKSNLGNPKKKGNHSKFVNVVDPKIDSVFKLLRADHNVQT